MIQNDVELQKIQVVDNNFSTWFNLASSIVVGYFIGMIILSATLYYQETLSYTSYILTLIIITISAFYTIFYLAKKRQDHFNFINNLIQKVENCESLPSLKNLKKTKN